MSNVDIAGITGRAWVFPDSYINTDAIMPRAGYDVSPREQETMVLASIRPGWAEQVEAGDILVAGRRFGTGSSRPAVTMLSRLGIAALVAESVADIFLRNCVSYAMPVLECPGILEAVREDDRIEVDTVAGTVRNRTTGGSAAGTPLPEMLLATIAEGGVYEQLRAHSYMQPGS